MQQATRHQSAIDAESQQAGSSPALPDIADNPPLGVLWFVIYTVQMTAILYVMKYIYSLNPDIEVLQVTSMKAIVSIAILIIVLNRKLKHIMYDSIDPDSKWALAYKSCQATVSILIQYNAMKYFSVSTTGVVCSLVPLIACILAALILKERLTVYTIVSVLIVLACIITILLGAEGKEAEAMEQNTWALVGLCAQPVLLASGMIAARKMKKNHPLAQTCYSNLILGVVSYIGVSSSSTMDYSFVPDLSGLSWFLFFVGGLLTIFEHTSKFLAFRYQEAAKLQKLAFLPNVWNFLIDLAFLHNEFSGAQLIGYGSLFTFYVAEMLRFYLFEEHEKVSPLANCDDHFEKVPTSSPRKSTASQERNEESHFLSDASPQKPLLR